jgi:hypothetical protein
MGHIQTMYDHSRIYDASQIIMDNDTQHPKHMQNFHCQFSQSLPKFVSLLLHVIILQLLKAAHTALSS